jgi:hypothetical protein
VSLTRRIVALVTVAVLEGVDAFALLLAVLDLALVDVSVGQDHPVHRRHGRERPRRSRRLDRRRRHRRRLLLVLCLLLLLVVVIVIVVILLLLLVVIVLAVVMLGVGCAGLVAALPLAVVVVGAPVLDVVDDGPEHGVLGLGAGQRVGVERAQLLVGRMIVDELGRGGGRRDARAERAVLEDGREDVVGQHGGVVEDRRVLIDHVLRVGGRVLVPLELLVCGDVADA